MASKLLSKGGDKLIGEPVLLAGLKTAEERVRDSGDRHRPLDRFDHAPAPFPRILDIAFDPGEGRVFRKSLLRQLQQPGADDAPPIPEMRNFLKIKREGRRLQQLKTLAVGFEHRILDPIVDHLGIMARAAFATVEIAVGRGEGLKNRLELFESLFLPADHHAVADRKPPDPAARPDVQKSNLSLPEPPRPPDRIFIKRIS